VHLAGGDEEGGLGVDADYAAFGLGGCEKGGVFGFFSSSKPAYGKEMRNDWAGEVGYSITPKQPLTVTALGRAVPVGTSAVGTSAVSVGAVGSAGSTGRLQANARVTIWDAATKKVIASAVVGPNATTPDQAGYSYVSLGEAQAQAEAQAQGEGQADTASAASVVASVVLQQGQTYYITQSCTKGMPDKWTNSDANAAGANQQLATLGTGVWAPDGSTYAFPTLTPNKQKGTQQQFAGIASFKVAVPPNPHPLPTATCVCSVPAAEFGKGTGTLKYTTTGSSGQLGLDV